ncbi:MAG TPA: sigma 54-interacting transcriptional regulator [Kofleriaceae bacterium]|nr:sigma 54-interacting transcriptional regulator [Kofleriaceae bacterium]
MTRRASPWIVLPAALALAYAIAVVAVSWSAPEKGFKAFTGQRVVDVDAAGVADVAGLREGDVIVSVDGTPIKSTLDYAFRVLRRNPGETVQVGVRRGSEQQEIAIELEQSSPPWSAIVATLLSLAMIILGISARISRPDDDVDARRFYRTSIVYALVYVGALSWPRLIVHPVLAVVFLAALFVSPANSLGLSIDFPHHAKLNPSARLWTRLAWAFAILVGALCTVGLGLAIADFPDGGDRGLQLMVASVALQCGSVPVLAAVGLASQLRSHRIAHGELRAQLRWIIAGHILGIIPVLVAIPFAVTDIDRFLITRYQPFVVSIAVLWSLGYGFAVLRIRLADVNVLLRSGIAYAATTTAAVGVYVGIVLAAGWITGSLVGDTGPLPHLIAGICAAVVFGPIRSATTRWLDRRFFRDRTHYLEALRRAGESLALLREPADLARESCEQIALALRAEYAALYTKAGVLYATPGAPAIDAAPLAAAPRDGIAVPVTDARTGSEPAWLVLGPRKSGDLYSTDDRDLLGAVASQLAIALANAGAFGKIKALSRTLESQNEQIRDLRDKLEDENRFLRQRVEAATDGARLVGTSKAMRELQNTLERAAGSDATVLLLGESGTGKGLAARTLHARSPRADKPFMQVDCGAIAASVFESELFGHERGAFTGATRTRRGPIELADGGTLFLDEIGELPLDLQPKLLRMLEDRTVLRVGATAPVSVDVRIIAATNRDLAAMVKQGLFREDLFFRLNVVSITVPSLRARRADLRELCEQLLPRVARRSGRDVRPLADDALTRMMAYAWPGNVRELENVLGRALVLGDGAQITADDLDLPDRPVEDEAPDEIAAEASKPHDAVMDDIERRRLSAALAAAEGNQSHAAKSLRMPRTTFINKLRRHGLL